MFDYFKLRFEAIRHMHSLVTKLLGTTHPLCLDKDVEGTQNQPAPKGLYFFTLFDQEMEAKDAFRRKLSRTQEMREKRMSSDS